MWEHVVYCVAASSGCQSGRDVYKKSEFVTPWASEEVSAGRGDNFYNQLLRQL